VPVRINDSALTSIDVGLSQPLLRTKIKYSYRLKVKGWCGSTKSW